MPEIIRTKERVYRDDYSSDDERSSSYRRPSGSYTTVQRYRVKPNRSLVVAEVDGDRRSTRSERLDIGTKHHHLEVDRRVERVDQIERPRSALEYRDSDRARETKRTIIYERDRDRAREPLSPRSWDRDRDVPYERERETDIRVERRHRERDGEPVEYERVSRETEYYGRPDPPSQTLVIRELPVEVVRREQSVENREVAPPLRRQEDEYYYRRDVREAEPRRDVVARYERREVRPRESVSNDGSDSEVIVRKERRVVRDRSHSPRHKLHIAEGALAGAGAAALLANHREKSGGGSDHRGRKVAAGAAVGALGAELITRARSQLRERSRNRSYSRSRSRSSSRGGHHTKLKTVLALGATALAAAAAGKYISNRNEQRKEEMARGRSRTRSVSRRRYSDDDDDDDAPGGKRDASHRAAAMAKAGAGAAIVGGLVEHFRNKSRGRSKSRLRTGGVAAATGLVGAAAAGIYEARKARQDAQDAAARRSSRSRSRARSLHNDDPAVDPELGMVEYGGAPVYTQPRDLYYDPAAAAAERSRERRASRSRSRVRDIASGALATGAAAIGINKYQKRREEKRAERERREAEHERRREGPDYSSSRSSSHSRTRSRSRSAIRASMSKRLSGLVP